MAAALRYGEIALVGNKLNPNSVVVFSHGLGDTCAGWAGSFRALASRVPQALFVLPTAPNQPVTLNGGARMPSWYDIASFDTDGRREDGDGVLRSAQYILKLVDDQRTKFNIPPHRAVVGGFSQGAVISIAAGLTSPTKLAGVISVSGYVGGRLAIQALGELQREVPIRMFHGKEDPMIPLQMSRGSRDLLTGLFKCKNVTHREYDGVGHGCNEPELDDVFAAIAELLPPL